MAYTGSSAAILSNYDEVLKTYYIEAAREQLNNKNILSSSIGVNERDVSGKNATILCHYGRTMGTGSRPDGGPMPEADYQKNQTCIIPMKYHYGQITFSGPTLRATRDDKGAYLRVVDNEIRGCVRDVMKEANRQMWGCGYGILGRWLTTAGATSYTLQKQYRGNTVGGDGFGSTFGGKYVSEAGHAVPLVMTTAAGSTFTVTTLGTTNMAVTAVDESQATYDTITCTNPSVSEAAGTVYIRPVNTKSQNASTAAGSARYEMMGLRGIVTDTDLDDIAFFDGSGNTGFTVNDPLQGLAVGTYGWWKAYVDSSSTRYGAQRQLTEERMQRVFDRVEEKAGKDYGPALILTTNALRREYLKILDLKRREPSTMVLNGGFTALNYNGVGLVTDPDCPDGEMYFITPSDLQIYRMSDYEWMSEDGNVLKAVSGYDAYSATLFRYSEMGCTRRNSHGVLADLAYTA